MFLTLIYYNINNGLEVFDIRRNSLIMIGVTVVVILVIIGVTAAVITHNSTANNTANNTTVNNTVNNTTMNATNNTTFNTNTTSTKSSSKKSKSSSSDGGYHYSAQYGTYVKEWDDGHGNSYLKSKNGEFYEHYNNRTGFYEYNYPGEGYVHN